MLFFCEEGSSLSQHVSERYLSSAVVMQDHARPRTRWCWWSGSGEQSVGFSEVLSTQCQVVADGIIEYIEVAAISAMWMPHPL